MNQEQPYYLPSRMMDYGQFSFYYAYGNRAAEDMLEYVHSEDEKIPTILSLGCGDPRSFFYTMWKHFTPTLSESHFFGAHFIFNDISGGILARNVLLLYLAMKIPPWTQREAAKQWISSMWAIWYCHELLPIHKETLKEALATLLKLSDTMKSWKESKHAISQIVSFTDDGTLVAIRRMWKMWLTKTFKLSKSNEVKLTLTLPEQNFVNVIQDWFQAIGLTTYTTKKVKDAMSAEFAKCMLEYPSVYAEECLNIPYSTDHKVVNPTFFEREDGMYTLPASTPFVCFHHGFIFSKSQIQKVMGTEFSELAMIVEDDAFLKHPFLSNSVQQFSMWVSSAATTLVSQQKTQISLKFNCSDCLAFCEELRKKAVSFDTIFTSNLIDYLPPPILVLAAKPLLKMTSYLLTTSFHYKRAFSSAEEYLSEIFGCSPSLLPLLFGVRCVGHEGEYGANTSIIPIPIQLQNLLTKMHGLLCQTDKVLFWQKVNSQPIIVRSLKDSPLSVLLYKAFFAQIVYFNRACSDTPVVMCTEAAINSVLSFVSQLDANVDINSHLFWEDFCTLIQSNGALRPFLAHIQTQAILHKLHFHLDENCPFCLKQPLEEHIGQFSIEFNPLSMDNLIPDLGEMPVFVVFIHKATVPFDQLESTDVHIVDSAQGVKLASGNIQLSFFFPVRFVEQDYFYTVVRYIVPIEGEKRVLPVATLSGELCKVKVPYQKDSFYFKEAGTGRTKSIQSSLGCILSHDGDGNSMLTTLSLNSKPLHLLSTKAKIFFEQLLPSTVQVSCGKYGLTLSLPYPVTVRNQVTNGKIVQISFLRKSSHVYDEKRAVVINPSFLMMLPTAKVPSSDISEIIDMQYPEQEEMLLKDIKSGDFNTKFFTYPEFVRVKLLISGLFQLGNTFMAYGPPTISVSEDKSPFAYLLVHKRAVDIQRCSPVLEIFYIISDDIIIKKLERRMCLLIQDMKTSESIATAPIDADTWLEFKQVLMYFARRTLPSSRNLPHQLRKHGLEKNFTRAIVYPLYCDQDIVYESVDPQVAEWEMPASFPTSFPMSPSLHSTTVAPSSTVEETAKLPISIEKECSFCFRKSDKLKKCTGCGVTWYCDRGCQSGHWKSHKKACNPIVAKASTTSEVPVITKCSNCNKKAEKLSNCSACQTVAYCSKECQRIDWPRHKTDCRKR